RAHAIGRGDEYGLFVLLRVQSEQTAEATDAAQYAGAERALDARLEPLNDVVTGFDRHSRVGVSSRAGDVERSTHQRLPTAPRVTGIGAGYVPVRQASQHSPSSCTAARRFASVMNSS